MTAAPGWFCVGRSLESRASEKNDCCGGGGRFKMDLPGMGIVTADDEADGESIAASQTRTDVEREVEDDGEAQPFENDQAGSPRA